MIRIAPDLSRNFAIGFGVGVLIVLVYMLARYMGGAG